MTVIQQGRYHCYDGIGVLGFSAVHTTVQLGVGLRMPGGWVPRDVRASDGMVVAPDLEIDMVPLVDVPADDGPPLMAWGFYYDDVDPAIVRHGAILMRRARESFPAPRFG